jgi:hypothetical protein
MIYNNCEVRIHDVEMSDQPVRTPPPGRTFVKHMVMPAVCELTGEFTQRRRAKARRLCIDKMRGKCWKEGEISIPSHLFQQGFKSKDGSITLHFKVQIYTLSLIKENDLISAIQMSFLNQLSERISSGGSVLNFDTSRDLVEKAILNNFPQSHIIGLAVGI